MSRFVANRFPGREPTAHTSWILPGTRSQRSPPVVRIILSILFRPLYTFLFLDSPEISPGALIGASSSSSTGPTGSATPSSGGGSSNTRAIVGGAVGAIAALVIAVVILGTLYLMLRRRRNKNSGDGRAMAEDATIPSPLMPDALLTSTSGRFSVRDFLHSHYVRPCSCHLFLVLPRIRLTRPRACCFLRCRQRRGSQTSLHK